MTGRAYYNECDPYAAAWLGNLIAAGLIMPGDVDTRSIVDVRPADVAGYERCHWFAGIGVWDYALGLAGWPTGRRVWTGSCPCQPFSAAGGRGGFADERHLWPSWHHLIRECRPDVVVGEQVASKDGLGWLDLVQADLEGTGYACGAIDLCAAGVGAPHIRQRLWFLAVAESLGGRTRPIHQGPRRERGLQPRDCGLVRIVADADGRDASAEGLQRGGQHGLVAEDGLARVVAHADVVHGDRAGSGAGHDGRQLGLPGALCAEPGVRAERWPGAHHGGWDDADWLRCRDGRWRPVEPSAFPLVDGSAFRLGSGSPFEGKSRTAMLKGYGNAINAQAAAAFIAACLDTLPTPSNPPAQGADDAGGR